MFETPQTLSAIPRVSRDGRWGSLARGPGQPLHKTKKALERTQDPHEVFRRDRQVLSITLGVKDLPRDIDALITLLESFPTVTPIRASERERQRQDDREEEAAHIALEALDRSLRERPHQWYLPSADCAALQKERDRLLLHVLSFSTDRCQGSTRPERMLLYSLIARERSHAQENLASRMALYNASTRGYERASDQMHAVGERIVGNPRPSVRGHGGC